jgi:hypothetical protein
MIATGDDERCGGSWSLLVSNKIVGTHTKDSRCIECMAPLAWNERAQVIVYFSDRTVIIPSYIGTLTT